MPETERELLIKIYESIKPLKEKLTDHEKRIRWLERIGYLVIGGYLIIKEFIK